jgi:hypothetical protein
MHNQTYPTQVFSVFGGYTIGPQGDYFPSNCGRPNSQDSRDAITMGSAAVLPEAAFLYLHEPS